MPTIVWTDYVKYRVSLRGYDFKKLTERYLDNETGRTIVVGRHEERLVMIPCEGEGNEIIPVTVHATTRQQIRFRLRTGRFNP
jgi:hypothetical protein